MLNGIFYVGCDPGKKQDFSAIAVIERLPDGLLRLVHIKRFRLGTEYRSVLGYLRLLNQKLATVRTIEIDQTGLGEYFVEDAIHSGIKNRPWYNTHTVHETADHGSNEEKDGRRKIRDAIRLGPHQRAKHRTIRTDKNRPDTILTPVGNPRRPIVGRRACGPSRSVRRFRIPPGCSSEQKPEFLQIIYQLATVPTWSFHVHPKAGGSRRSRGSWSALVLGVRQTSTSASPRLRKKSKLKGQHVD